LPSATSPEVPTVRRRQWTDNENRDFERWITNNPNPTKPQKVEFAASHQHLALSQVQNKINNWRNGRNIQNQRVANTGAHRDGLLSSSQGLELNTNAPASTTSEANIFFTDIYSLLIDSQDSTMPIAQDTVARVAAVSVPSELFENMRSISPVSSIMRYIDSPELEADQDAIERALKAASDECLYIDNAPSPCMRLPSLRHQTSSEKLSSAKPYVATVQPRPRQDQIQSRHCAQCTEQGLSVS